jgi:hypothetical protein
MKFKKFYERGRQAYPGSSRPQAGIPRQQQAPGRHTQAAAAGPRQQQAGIPQRSGVESEPQCSLSPSGV